MDRLAIARSARRPTCSPSPAETRSPPGPMTPPAHWGGERGALLFRAKAAFDLAARLRKPPGVPLGEVFSFLSGLYFRGKLAYAEAFAAPPAGLAGMYVITPSEGLRRADELVDLARLRGFAQVDIDAADARYHRPLPRDPNTGEAGVGGPAVPPPTLRKPFWPEEGRTKRDLLQYYFDLAPVLLPHLKDRAMVMKRYPNGAGGPFFFMKRAPSPRPDWIETRAIQHASKSVIDFPGVQHVAALLWVVNLGCSDLNP